MTLKALPKPRTLSFVAAFFILLIMFSINTVPVRAHTFSPDESASFLSLVDQIKSSLIPIKQDVATNLTLAREQGQYARLLLTDYVVKELKERNERIATKLLDILNSLKNVTVHNVDANLSDINDILAETVTVRIEKNQLNNATIHALAFANDINKILDEYTTAFMKDNVSKANGMHTSSMKMNMTHSMDKMKSNSSSGQDIEKLAAYQRANALTELASNRFNTELKVKSNITSSIDDVVNGLEQLKELIQNKSPTSTVMSIIHGQIQPSLQKAFNLELAQSNNTAGMSHVSNFSSMANMTNNNESMKGHFMNNS
jgi:hypothetical protein